MPQRRLLLILIALVATLVPAGEANGAVADFGAPLDGRALLQWMPEQFGTGHSYTAGQAVAAAQRYDVISAFPQAFGSAVPSMRSANPRLVLLAYSNGMFAPATRGPASANPFPLDWYARDASGNYIQNASNNNWLMNPANSGWVQNRASNCATLIAQSGYDGCMLDTLGVAPLTAGYCTSLAYNAATGANWTRADWLNATTQLAAAARSTVTPSLVVGNGLKDGPSIAESQQLFNGMDGAMAESFLRAATQSASTYPSVTTWQQNVDMLSTPPKPILAVTKLFAQATSAQAAQWHLFSMASFLLGTDGRSYFYFASSSSEQPISTTPWTTGVGSPTAAYGLRDGVYQRPFTNGRVVVNPSASAVTVPLDGVYTRQDGTVVAGSLSMPPSTGEVLTNSSAAVPDAPTGVTATAGDASVVVSFVAPQNDGGSAVTGYTATATDGADGSTVAATGNASPITIGGLTNGHSYTVSVAATNAVGTGAPSAPSNAATPTAPVVLSHGSAPGFAVVGVAYRFQLTAGGGTSPYSWSIGAGTLPKGLTLTAGGLISGTPTAAGTSSVTLAVRDAAVPANTLSWQTAITVYAKAPNGSGSEGVTPTAVRRSSTGNVFTITYTASASGAMFDGRLAITVPSAWTAPSLSGAGAVTAAQGSVSVSNRTITVSGLRLAPGATLRVTYGSTVGGLSGVTVGSKAGSFALTTKESSTATGTLAALASSPAVTLN